MTTPAIRTFGSVVMLVAYAALLLARPRHARLAWRQHAFLATIFVIIPALFLAEEVVGTKSIVGSTGFLLANSLFDLMDWVMVVGLLLKGLRGNPMAIAALIFAIGAAGFASRLDPVGGFVLSVLSEVVGWGTLLSATADSHGIRCVVAYSLRLDESGLQSA